MMLVEAPHTCFYLVIHYEPSRTEFLMAEFVYQMYQARKAHGDKVI